MKIPYMFCGMWKNLVFGDKNSDMCLLHKIKSFNLKIIRSVFFRTKKKMVFQFVNDQICFLVTKKKGF